ncbi:MAG: hypothetical protein H8E30_12575 [Alphaproteobacteria bacterium]|nr:hypothetical protein [Alphaproteobacteria bacterium]
MVTLYGATVPGRGSASFLNAVGLPQYVARTPAQYVAVAVAAAADIKELASLRAGLRERREE